MKFLYSNGYRNMLINQTKEQIIFFLKNSIEFNIIVNMDSGVSFNPELPEEIYSGFGNFTLFALAGYTFQSAYIENNVLIFEAGFGKENFGSIVRVDIDRILQIIKDETPIFINPIASIPKQTNRNSFEIFKSKNKNKKFFKK
jgi:hypothetical protein